MARSLVLSALCLPWLAAAQPSARAAGPKPAPVDLVSSRAEGPGARRALTAPIPRIRAELPLRRVAAPATFNRPVPHARRLR